MFPSHCDEIRPLLRIPYHTAGVEAVVHHSKWWARNYAMGQKRRSKPHPVMSALPPKATVIATGQVVAKSQERRTQVQSILMSSALTIGVHLIISSSISR